MPVADVCSSKFGLSVNCPALDDWFKQSFKALVSGNSNRRKRDEDDGFAIPGTRPSPGRFFFQFKSRLALPVKRKREETPSQGPEVGRDRGTPMNVGDEHNWGNDIGFGAEMGKLIPAYIVALLYAMSYRYGVSSRFIC